MWKYTALNFMNHRRDYNNSKNDDSVHNMQAGMHASVFSFDEGAFKDDYAGSILAWLAYKTALCFLERFLSIPYHPNHHPKCTHTQKVSILPSKDKILIVTNLHAVSNTASCNLMSSLVKSIWASNK